MPHSLLMLVLFSNLTVLSVFLEKHVALAMALDNAKTPKERRRCTQKISRNLHYATKAMLSKGMRSHDLFKLHQLSIESCDRLSDVAFLHWTRNVETEADKLSLQRARKAVMFFGCLHTRRQRLV